MKEAWLCLKKYYKCESMAWHGMVFMFNEVQVRPACNVGMKQGHVLIRKIKTKFESTGLSTKLVNMLEKLNKFLS